MKPLNLAIYMGAFALMLISCKKEDTLKLPTLSTLAVIEILPNSSKSGGNIANDGGAAIISRGIIWGLTTGITLEQHAGLTVDGTGIGIYTSNLSNLTPNTTYYVRAYATSNAGTGYGQQINFTTQVAITLPEVSTTTISNITHSSATSGGNVGSDGGASVTARGVCWSTSTNPTVANSKTTNGSGTGVFTSNITGLSASTTYYARAYATNSAGTGYGEPRTFTTTPSLNPGDVFNPTTGKIWKNRNLGSTQVATSSTDANSYGHLYQWGRGTDGHQERTSGTRITLSSNDSPGHANFILAPDTPYDWRSPQNTNLWLGVSGTNNPCPTGYRLPTDAELNAERLSWSSNNAAGAYASPLKFPSAGFRRNNNGSLSGVGSDGSYWSSTINSTNSRSLDFGSSSAGMIGNFRAFGFSVRCIKN